MHTLFGTYYYFVLNISHDLISPNNNNDESLASYSTALIIVCFMVSLPRSCQLLMIDIENLYFEKRLSAAAPCDHHLSIAHSEKSKVICASILTTVVGPLVSTTMYHMYQVYILQGRLKTYIPCLR